jgi:hypothetical protein
MRIAITLVVYRASVQLSRGKSEEKKKRLSEALRREEGGGV